MSRPRKNRRICCNPSAYYFKPRGIPVCELLEIVLEHDELEALRLADLLAYSHENAATEMKISRATFGRIVESARRKVTDGVLNGKAIRINKFKPKNIYLRRNKNEDSSSNKRPKKSNRTHREMQTIYDLRNKRQ